jgi:hypothetical protein
MKLCSKCKTLKEYVYFAIDTRYKCGRYPSCKSCKKQLQQEHYIKNKEEIVKKDIARKINKYHNDPLYKLKHQLRSRLRTALSREFRSGLAIEHLGCSIEQFRCHLESKFKPGMTWDNNTINGWHIDHIKPLSSFDLSDPEQIKKAVHYVNLQPLWAKDNWSKK